GLLAVHAGHGLEMKLAGVVGGAFDVAVDAQPVHLAAAADLLLADHGNVVLRLTRDDAGAAAGAGGEIDDHAPLMIRRRMRLVERERLTGAAAGLLANARLVRLGGETRRALILLQGRRTHQLAILHQMMGLRAGEQRGAARPTYRQTGGE